MSNKIKASDCRVGNWLSKYGEQYQITSATIVGLERGDSEVEPISLTEEWLLKFGFEFRNTDKQYGWFLVVSKNRFLTWCHSKEVSLEFGLEDYGYNNTLFDFHCEYAHQLQNLFFALTNQELT